MNLKKYIPKGKYYQHLSDIRQIGVARALLDGVEIKRDEIRALNEGKPQFCKEDLKKDIVFRAGAVCALNWVLNLPDEARKIISQLPDN